MIKSKILEKNPGWILVLRQKILLIFSKYSVPRWLVFILDNGAVFLMFIFAYILRFNFHLEDVDLNLALDHALITLAVYALFSLKFRSYTGLLRHTTLTDISLVFVVTTLSVIILISLSLISRFLGWNLLFTIPLSIILIHYASITVTLFFIRVFVKVIFRFVTSSIKDTKKVLIYGAGDLGFIVKRVILSDPEYGLNVAGFIDENKTLHGKKINGIPVYNPNLHQIRFLYLQPY